MQLPWNRKKEAQLDQRTATVLARLEAVVVRFEDAANRLEESIEADEARTDEDRSSYRPQEELGGG